MKKTICIISMVVVVCGMVMAGELVSDGADSQHINLDANRCSLEPAFGDISTVDEKSDKESEQYIALGASCPLPRLV